MKRKIVLSILGILTVFIFLGCAQPTEQVEDPAVPEPTPEVETPTEPAETPPESAADSVEIENVDEIEEELSFDDLDDLDAVLSDIENI